MVGQVGRGGGALKPHGSYNPSFNNFPKAKITFELELPKDASFAADYVRGVAFLKRLERNARPAVEGRNLFLDSSAHSNIRFGAPLFRPKRDDADQEEMPDDYISSLAADAAYFPTSANWPILNVHAEAFHAALVEHVFCPIHVVDVSDKYVEPNDFATHLPGALVKVYFTLRYWNFKGKSYNSYSANIQQVHILQAAPTSSLSIGKRLVARASARVAGAGPATGKRGASPDADGPVKKAKIHLIQELPKAVGDGHADDSGPSAPSGVAVPNAPEAIVHVPIVQPGNEPHITHAGTSRAPKGFVDVPDVAQAETLGALETMVNVSVEGKQASEASIKDAKGKRGSARV
ncbi:hypothetical protein BDN71DRAFT_1455643 [Pleurotus eryngii]|uniref:Uncharacterized protein n=1 Tax=Pleurotus eryngii TaxID=5323 RepID=A0A9P6DBI2_PLEER|nr:hypothetical protein BDN71DRAFT_1455643 [Pleurotus eryngii]